MGTYQVGKNMVESHSTLLQSAWDEYLARWISRIGSPPLTAMAGAVLSGHMLATPVAWRWAAVYTFLAILAPIMYVVWLFHRGKVADLDLRIREQRIRPLLVTLTGAFAAWAMLHFGAAPTLLVVLASANAVQMILFFGITLRWKISGHCTAAAGLIVLAWALIGSAAILLTLSVPLIAWARVRLHHHTIGQTVAGAALGSSVLTAAFLVYGG